MPDYKTMYLTLFNAVTDAISLLQQAQQRTEQIYIEGTDTVLKLMETDTQKDESQISTDKNRSGQGETP